MTRLYAILAEMTRLYAIYAIYAILAEMTRLYAILGLLLLLFVGYWFVAHSFVIVRLTSVAIGFVAVFGLMAVVAFVYLRRLL